MASLECLNGKHFVLRESETDFKAACECRFHRMVYMMPYEGGSRPDDLMRYIGDNVNPIMVKFENQGTGCVYFGSDIPVVREHAAPRNRCKSYRRWCDSMRLIDYKYLDVAEPKKLFNYKVDYKSEDIVDYLYDVDGVKIFRLDYTHERLERMQRDKDERALRERRMYNERVSHRGEPGYCEHCGSSDASFVVNPYYYEMYGRKKKEWICRNCYDEFLGDV